MGDNILSRIPGELLSAAKRALQEAQPDGPASKAVIVCLPNAQLARISFVRMMSGRGWVWVPERAELL